MLIIEGADCVGKTTLARKMAGELKLLYQHLGPMPEGWEETDYIRLGCQKVVYDRFHVSDVVYSKVLNRAPCIENPRFLHAALQVRFAAFTVIIAAEPELISLRFREADQMYNEETVLKCNELFAKCAAHYADYVIRTSVTNPYPDENDIKAIVKGWTAKQECQAHWKDTLKSST